MRLNEFIEKICKHPYLSQWTAPLALMGISFLAYGTLLPYLGIYWDDLPTFWFHHIGGREIFYRVFASDRPFLGFVFQFTLSVLGDSIILWQIFSLIIRGITAIALYFLLQELFWNNSSQNFIVSALFVLYPGFSQQWIAVTYSHIFLSFIALIVSLGLTAASIKNPPYKWLLLSMALGLDAFSLFIAEYFIGLEILRLLIIGYLLFRQKNKRPLVNLFLDVIKNWIPYAVLLGGFLYWRLFIHPFPRGEIQTFISPKMTLIEGIFTFLTNVIQDMVEAGLFAWSLPLHVTETVDLKSDYLFKMIVLGEFTFLAVWMYLKWFSSQDNKIDSNHHSNWGVKALYIGFVALFLGGIPSFMTSLRLHLTFPADRFTLAMSLGASFLMCSIIIFFIDGQSKRNLFFSVLIALIAIYHYHVADNYRLEWQQIRNFFWELKWRVPSLEPNTSIVTYGLPFIYYTDNSLSAPLQWTYFPQEKTLKTILVDTKTRSDFWQSVLTNTPLNISYRAVSYTTNPKQNLVLFYDNRSCLQVIDERYQIYNPIYPAGFYRLIPLSRPSVIPSTNSKQDASLLGPAWLFGREPAHNWCYYYQKSALARQQKDWKTIYYLSIEAQEKGYLPILLPSHSHEYIPFIEAYAHLGYYNKAINFTRHALNQSDGSLRIMLCEVWKDLNLDDDEGKLVRLQMINEMRCQE